MRGSFSHWSQWYRVKEGRGRPTLGGDQREGQKARPGLGGVPGADRGTGQVVDRPGQEGDQEVGQQCRAGPGGDQEGGHSTDHGAEQVVGQGDDGLHGAGDGVEVCDS